jgi:hypothetical protein
MSRAYRIRVHEAERKLLKAEDSVRANLGLLEILPGEEMAALLIEELKKRGFRDDEGMLRRDDDGVTITVDPCTGDVIAQAEVQDEVKIESRREGVAYDDIGPAQKAVRQQLQEKARDDLNRQKTLEQEKLQKKATEKLEGRLLDVKKELDQAVNRVTAEALKKKAAQMGQIKEIHDDIENGSLTITVEV